jgi:hypothetical protein
VQEDALSRLKTAVLEQSLPRGQARHWQARAQREFDVARQRREVARASMTTYSARVPSRCRSARPNTRCPSDSPVALVCSFPKRQLRYYLGISPHEAQSPNGIVSSVSFVSTTNTARSFADR